MSVRVFHRASLGDSVLLWPFLRTLRSRGIDTTLVTDRSKGRLASRELGVAAVDAESESHLWVESAPINPLPGVARVVAFVDLSGAGRVWESNARRAFPGATFDLIPERLDRLLAMRLAASVAGPAAAALHPPVRLNQGGDIVLHVGAGSQEKRWPLDRFAALAARVGKATLLAGEVEVDRFSPGERRCFEDSGGRFLPDLDQLTDAIRAARAFVGNDSGPTHLAAQLGVPTLALFGPTDPSKWAPIGPRVSVVAPPGPLPMDVLAVDDVAARLATLLGAE